VTPIRLRASATCHPLSRLRRVLLPPAPVGANGVTIPGSFLGRSRQRSTTRERQISRHSVLNVLPQHLVMSFTAS
jgi:hypothetical protein